MSSLFSSVDRKKDLKVHDRSWVFLDEFNHKPYVDYFQFSNSNMFLESSASINRSRSLSLDTLKRSQVIENLHSVSDWYKTLNKDPDHTPYLRQNSGLQELKRRYSNNSLMNSCCSSCRKSPSSSCSSCQRKSFASCNEHVPYDLNWKNMILQDFEYMFSLRNSLLFSITLSHFFAFAIGIYIGHGSLRRKH